MRKRNLYKEKNEVEEKTFRLSADLIKTYAFVSG